MFIFSYYLPTFALVGDVSRNSSDFITKFYMGEASLVASMLQDGQQSPVIRSFTPKVSIGTVGIYLTNLSNKSTGAALTT